MKYDNDSCLTGHSELIFQRNDLVARQVYQALVERKERVSFAESCTGGALCCSMVRVPGVSEILEGGVVAYDSRLKRELLGVGGDFLEEAGVVSRETAMAMASGAAIRLGSDWAVSTTGYAGPGGGDARYGVGTVCIGIFYKKSVEYARSFCRVIRGSRLEVMEDAVYFALKALADVLSERSGDVFVQKNLTLTGE